MRRLDCSHGRSARSGAQKARDSDGFPAAKNKKALGSLADLDVVSASERLTQRPRSTPVNCTPIKWPCLLFMEGAIRVLVSTFLGLAALASVSAQAAPIPVSAEVIPVELGAAPRSD